MPFAITNQITRSDTYKSILYFVRPTSNQICTFPQTKFFLSKISIESLHLGNYAIWICYDWLRKETSATSKWDFFLKKVVSPISSNTWSRRVAYSSIRFWEIIQLIIPLDAHPSRSNKSRIRWWLNDLIIFSVTR